MDFSLLTYRRGTWGSYYKRDAVSIFTAGSKFRRKVVGEVFFQELLVKHSFRRLGYCSAFHTGVNAIKIAADKYIDPKYWERAESRVFSRLLLLAFLSYLISLHHCPAFARLNMKHLSNHTFGKLDEIAKIILAASKNVKQAKCNLRRNSSKQDSMIFDYRTN